VAVAVYCILAAGVAIIVKPLAPQFDGESGIRCNLQACEGPSLILKLVTHCFAKAHGKLL
jgi:hypothetical protein